MVRDQGSTHLRFFGSYLRYWWDRFWRSVGFAAGGLPLVRRLDWLELLPVCDFSFMLRSNPLAESYLLFAFSFILSMTLVTDASFPGWAALINTVSDSGVSDILLTVLILAFFGLCFVFGFTEWGRLTGITLLGIEGGVAFAVRIMILRPGYGLLLGEGNGLYEAMWALVIFCGSVGGGGVIFGKTQRMALVRHLLVVSFALLNRE